MRGSRVEKGPYTNVNLVLLVGQHGCAGAGCSVRLWWSVRSACGEDVGGRAQVRGCVSGRVGQELCHCRAAGTGGWAVPERARRCFQLLGANCGQEGDWDGNQARREELGD